MADNLPDQCVSSLITDRNAQKARRAVIRFIGQLKQDTGEKNEETQLEKLQGELAQGYVVLPPVSIGTRLRVYLPSVTSRELLVPFWARAAMIISVPIRHAGLRFYAFARFAVSTSARVAYTPASSASWVYIGGSPWRSRRN